MKNLFIVFLMISVTFLYSCEDKEELPNDVISYHEITKNITSGQIDSVYTEFGFILFEINETQDGKNLVMIKSPYFDHDIIGNGSIYCIIDDKLLNNVRILERDFVISEDKNWSSMNDGLSLNSFAGVGKSIIGLRFCNPSNDPDNDVFFGWIEVQVSENKDSLTIYGFASSLTTSNSIKAGQIE